MRNTWILFDTSSSGYSLPIYPVELAALRMRGWKPDGKPFRRLINQNVEISPETSRVHGYTREILERDGAPPAEVYRNFDAYAGDLALCAFNLPYDLEQVLIPDWLRLGIKPIGRGGFCILKLAQRLLDPIPVENCKLETLRAFYRLPERGAHSALGNVLTVADLLEHVLQPIAVAKGLKTWKTLSNYTTAEWFPRRLLFGKFKGHDFLDARTNTDLKAWLEWLAESPSERSSRMGRWYLEHLSSLDDTFPENIEVVSIDSKTAESQFAGANVVVYRNPDLDLLERAISGVRLRIAELEAELASVHNAVNVTQARLFRLLRPSYQKRDRLNNVIYYRRKFLDTLLQGSEDDIEQVVYEAKGAQEQTEAEYERTATHAECQRSLTDDEQQELKSLFRKLVNLYHPDRYANEPHKLDSYQRLTAAINKAREDGDIATLREIANDPEGFMRRNGLGTLDFSDEAEVKSLRQLLESLEAKLFSTIEMLNTLYAGAEYELYKLSLTRPNLIDEVAKEHAAILELEIAELEKEASRLEQEIVNLTGRPCPVN